MNFQIVYKKLKMFCKVGHITKHLEIMHQRPQYTLPKIKPPHLTQIRARARKIPKHLE